MRFRRGLAFLVAALISTAAQAQYSDGIVKIGVLTDMSSLYADLGGPGSVAAAIGGGGFRPGQLSSRSEMQARIWLSMPAMPPTERAMPSFE